MFYVSAPRNVDPEALRKLHEALREVVTSPQWKEMATKFGLLLEPLGPTELTSALEQWDQYFSRLARELNIQQEK
jgi:tripartite-type tricarboxylate transporter receptor subunit TctC